MAIKRINEFTSGSGTLTGDDIFLIMDDPSGSAITKHVSLNSIIESSDAVISDTSIVAGSGTEVNNIVILDQSTYNNIAPQSGVVYLISEDTFQGDATVIDGTINNYNPGVVTDTVRVSGINTPILTGLSYTDYNNDAGLFINVGSNDITVKHNDSNSSASNRFIVSWAGDYNVSASGGSFLAVRDKTDNVWRIV